MTIGELCNRDTFIIDKNDTIEEAAKRMRVFNVGDLIVVSVTEKGNTPIGIVTDRDIVVGIVADNADAQDMKVSAIMSKELVTGSEEDPVYEGIEQMKQHGIRRLPVVDKEGYLAGILSVDDLLEFLGEEINSLIHLIYKEQHA
ncbi:MAG: CBS domain-containing protein [Helicobacteraceae bacterium]|nr:CBS domain-containing protein [Helicobacteraceae bacterium]